MMYVRYEDTVANSMKHNIYAMNGCDIVDTDIPSLLPMVNII